MYEANVYGYVNGEAVSSRDEYVFKCRRRGPIETDAELIEFAKEATHNWFDAGWGRSFESFYLSDYALSEPYRSLTKSEFERLKQLQKEAIDKAKAADDAREWKLVETLYWADNSVEEIYEDKDGNRKTEMVVYPHGD